MNRFPILGTMLLIPALALPAMIVGCKDTTKDTAKDTKPVDTAASKDTKGGGTATDITTPTDGVVKGFVKLKGAVPEMVLDPRLGKHDEKEHCLAGKGKNIVEQLWLVNKDGTVANVVVSLGAPAGKKYKIDAKLRDAFKTQGANLDQPYCAYVPHVVGLYADVQPLVVKNSAKITHNTKITPAKKGEPLNKILAPNETWKPGTLKHESEPIEVACSMHGFMNAKIWTFEHPYFAVTKDDGSFEIPNVPTGEELVVYVWHESMGKKAMESQKSTFKAGDNTLELKIDGPK